MSLYGGVVGTDYRVWFFVDDGLGSPKTGLATEDIVARVVDFNDSANVTPEVSASIQSPGMYYFDVPGTFLTTYGAGKYGLHLIISKALPKFNATSGKHFVVNDIDIDDITNSVWNAPNSNYFISGSTGDSLYSGSVASVGNISISASVDVNSIVSGVWNAGDSGFNNVNTMGYAQNLQYSISSSIQQLSTSIGNVQSRLPLSLVGNKMDSHMATTTAIYDNALIMSLYSSERGPAIFVDNYYPGTSGTVPGVNGTVNNPVPTIAEAKALATALDIQRYHLSGDHTLDSIHQSWDFFATAFARLDMGNQDVWGSRFTNLTLNGIIGANNSGLDITADYCLVGSMSGLTGILSFCRITSVISMPTTLPTFSGSENGLYMFHCVSDHENAAISGAGTVSTSLKVYEYNGTLAISNIANVSSLVDTTYSGGRLTFTNTNVSGSRRVSGIVELTDNSTGGATTEISRVERLVDTRLSTIHGSSSWETATGFAAPGSQMNLTSGAVNLIWDETYQSHLSTGSMGLLQYSASLANSLTSASIASAVWLASESEFSLTGTMAGLQNKATIIDDKLTVMSGTVGVISGCVDFIKNIESGRWKIDTSLNQMIFYATDNVTEIARFNLFDETGTPTFDSPFERRRV